MVDRTDSWISSQDGPRWGLAVALALLALVLLLVVVRVQPPSPKPQNAPPDEFSAGRARQVLGALLGDGSPHPTGSPANARVRDRILARLRGLGYAPEVQRAFACNASAFGNCAWVENVLARLPGRQPGGAVLLVAHYDSVSGGPGASDDMTGVAAVLEVARALKAGPPPLHDILLLLDDGEEAGLLGAQAFVNQHPAAGQVQAVVNLEARGTSGPSLMFETSGPNRWLVSLFARHAPHPIMSSVFATIYDQLPNDTDLTIFKHRPQPVPGLNFAYIRRPAFYHTAHDDFAHASPASLQHHGDNALAAVRAAADADFASRPRGGAVFFDVLGFFVVRWPAGLSLVLALLALVLVVFAVVRARRRGARGGVGGSGGMGFGLLGFLAVVIAGGLAAFLLHMLLQMLGAFPIPWLARPLPYMAAFWLLVLAVVIAVASLFRRTGPAGLWAGVWLGWALLGVVVSWLAVGLSYLFVVPALVAGLAGLLPSGRRDDPASGWLTILPAVVAGLLWLPVILPLYDGLGTLGFLVMGVLLTVLLTTVAPLVPVAGTVWRRWLPLAAVALALVLAVVGLRSPRFSADSPQPVSFQFHLDADTGQARWIGRLSPPMPGPLRQAAGFAAPPQPPFPWSLPFARAFVAPAPAVALPAPELTVLESATAGGKRTVHLHLASPRGAQIQTLVIPRGAKPEALAVDGNAVQLGAGAGKRAGAVRREPDYRILTFLNVPPGGADLRFVLGETQPTNWYVTDRTPGLPAAGEALERARPATTIPFQDGDTTLVSRKVTI